MLLLFWNGMGGGCYIGAGCGVWHVMYSMRSMRRLWRDKAGSGSTIMRCVCVSLDCGRSDIVVVVVPRVVAESAATEAEPVWLSATVPRNDDGLIDESTHWGLKSWHSSSRTHYHMDRRTTTRCVALHQVKISRYTHCVRVHIL